jgi:hypothetical protein
MYEPNDSERNLICHLRACGNETLKIITPGSGARMLTAAPCFEPFHRRVRKVRLHRTRPTLHMLIQRRLRANEERSVDGRQGGSHQKWLCAAVPQRDRADTHTFSDRSAK